MTETDARDSPQAAAWARPTGKVYRVCVKNPPGSSRFVAPERGISLRARRSAAERVPGLAVPDRLRSREVTGVNAYVRSA
jgi:hypothetical protein